MEYSFEFLARVYGAYILSEIYYTPNIPAYGDTPRIGTMLSVCSYTTEILVGGFGMGNNQSTTIDLSKLLLTPLSAITDEHAIEVAKMCGYAKALKDVQLKIGRDCVIGVKRGAFVEQFYVMQEVIDKLREWGYDCGYAELPSLISAGLAIDKTTLNN